MSTKSLIKKAKIAAKEGDKAQARRILAQAAKQEPKNEQIYIHFALVAENETRVVQALEHVLKLNPHNEFALRGLDKLRHKGEQQAEVTRVEREGVGERQSPPKPQVATLVKTRWNTNKPLVIVGAALLIVACMVIGVLGITGARNLLSQDLAAPQGSDGARFPLYPGAKSISLSETDKATLIMDVFGRELLLYSWSADFSWTEDTGLQVEQRFNEKLPESKWRLEMDWIGFDRYYGSEWKLGNLRARILYIDNFSTEDMSELERRYGISGPTPGSTLIMVHVLDESLPLPDETATAEASMIQSTETASTLHQAETETAQVQSEMMTSTAQFHSEMATATEVAVQISVEATQSAEMTATAVVLYTEELEKLSDEFDGNVASDQWTIYRPDPANWDLTDREGWLHIVGREPTELGALNIFTQSVPPTDLAVTTGIEIDASGVDQYAWIALSSGEYLGGYDSPSYTRLYFDLPNGTVELGLASTSEGMFVYMWSCDRNSIFGGGCGSHQDERWSSGMHADSLGLVPIYQDEPVYLKMERTGQQYTGYYSLDGVSWSYVGEIDEFEPMTDQVYLGAIRGYDANQFDVYFDFVHYELMDR